MLKHLRYFTAAMAILFVFNFVSLAQTTPVAQQRAEDNYVTEKGFKSKVFEVKHRDPDSLARVLRSLGSGFKGASVAPNSEFRTLTVRDFPENLIIIEEALARLDTAVQPRRNIEMHMHVLIGSNTAGAAQAVPAELKDVLAQLSQVFNYKNYTLATSVVQRLTETTLGLRGKGTAEISRSDVAGMLNLPYEYHINFVTIASTPTGSPIIQIGQFAFSTGSVPSAFDTRTQVQTALNIREGEKVVVGTATLGDRALIIVLTAKLVG